MIAYLLTALIVAAFGIADGFVLMMLWKWFVTTSFGLPQLSLAAATGLVFTVGFLTNQYVPLGAKEDMEERAVNGMKHQLSMTFTALLMGWLFHFLV